MRSLRSMCCLLLWSIAAWPGAALATWSIVACDPDGSCGVAVATHNLAVGASVPYAQAGVGALASQFETLPAHGPQALALLAQRRDPEAVIQALLARDPGDDGDASQRQIGLVAADGASAVYNGAQVMEADWAGAWHGRGFCVQGNGLAGPQVLARMRERFLAERGALAQRLLAALEAGQAAGGQRIGTMSAALLVRTPEGGWDDVDLRVDAAAQPVRELRALLDRRQAHQLLLRAERLQDRGDAAGAARAAEAALALGHDWDRLWRRAARLAMQQGDRATALARLARFHQLNPIWTRLELRDPLYAPLATEAQLAPWR